MSAAAVDPAPGAAPASGGRRVTEPADRPTRVRIFYPADPVGVVPGGIDTFLRGLIKWAPEGLEFSLVGMTTDPRQRPVGRWTRCRIGEREFDFFAAVAVADAGSQQRIPLSLRYTLACRRYMAQLHRGFDVFDFHRLEPSLLFEGDGRPKNAYFHNDPQILRQAGSDNRWKYLPRLYERIERRAMAGISTAWSVRESGVELLRERYPGRAARIRFIPTWVDPQDFHPVPEALRQTLRQRHVHLHRLDDAATWIVSVGRLDTQKDPALMLAAFALLCREGRRLQWLVVGDGVLRDSLERGAAAAGIADSVRFVGLRSRTEIADLLRVADAFALSSAYEGMPMALLEALGTGLPAAVTDVGEVRRVVVPGHNGAIARGREPADFAAALADVLDHLPQYRGAPALAAAAPFRPADVLEAAYDNYRSLGRGLSSLGAAVDGDAAGEPSPRRRGLVVGVPIDLLDRQSVSTQLCEWARRGESRYMCFVNVHSAIQANYDERHRLVLLGADLAAPDGAPIAWTLRRKGHTEQRRVDGPGMMWTLCHHAQIEGVKVGLYGSSPSTLEMLLEELRSIFPQLVVSYAYSPPFRDLTDAEDAAVCEAIAQAGVGLLFVGLGCPKQEFWMAEHRGRIPAVMLGVGAAFEFHAGTVSRAPHWMREHGLEWLYRLSTQPRRLWRRYLFSNSMFLAKTAREAAGTVAKRLRRPGG